MIFMSPISAYLPQNELAFYYCSIDPVLLPQLIDELSYKLH